MGSLQHVGLPEGKILIPGVIDSVSNFVDHPRLVAQRLIRFAEIVGGENVIAAPDCGFGTFAFRPQRVHPEIMWTKFAAMVEGAGQAPRPGHPLGNARPLPPSGDLRPAPEGAPVGVGDDHADPPPEAGGNTYFADMFAAYATLLLGMQVQVSPELIETTSAADKWGAPFDAAITDVFQVQADIAGQVAQQLRVALTPASQQVITQRPTENLAAYDLFLKGEEVGQSVSINDPVALTQAVAFYQQAVALDSGFAPAWAQLGHAEAVLFSQGNAASQRVELAREAIDHARALSPTSTQTLLAQGSYDRSVLHDNSKALAEFTAGLKDAPHNAELLSAAAISEESFGRWEAAVAHFRQAEALDPRSVATARGLEEAYQWLRRYPDALAGCDRALALSPGDVSAFQDKAMIKLAQGDLAGARALIATPPPSIDSATLVAFMGTYYDLYWLLDDSQQRLLASLPVAPFGGDPSTRAVVLAQVYAFLGNPVKSRRYADSAQLLYAASLRATPQDAQTRVERGIALVYLGRRDEAIREGELAVHQLGMSADAHSGPYIQHQLVRIYLLAGEPEKALEQLEPFRNVPYFLSLAWGQIDPKFAPLHGNLRFERIVARR